MNLQRSDTFAKIPTVTLRYLTSARLGIEGGNLYICGRTFLGAQFPVLRSLLTAKI
jgi:hypothetical protein